MIFAAIADWADSDDYPVTLMCAWLGVSRAGYYAWRTAAPSARSKEDTTLIAIMRALYAQGRGNPGVRRLRAGLAAAGHRVSHKRVHRLMQAAGLQGRHPRAWKRTTLPGQRPVPAPDLIGRVFTAERLNEKWCGDITYVKTWDGWAYVATVIDLHSRAIIGHAVADHMRTSLVTDALDMALAARKPPAGVIFHSDRGTQYTSQEFDDYCRREQHPSFSGPYRDLLRQRRLRIHVRHLQEGTHPHPAVARPEDPHGRNTRLDQQLLQHHPPPLHPRILDTPRIRARVQNNQPTGSLNRCPEKREHSTLEVGRRLQLDDVVVVEWTCNYGDGRLYRNVTIGELEDGCAVRVTDYWGEPTVTPEWRQRLTDRLDMPGDGIWPDAEHLGHH